MDQGSLEIATWRSSSVTEASITSVKGFARLLSRREVPPDEVRQFGELIADAVDRFDRVVEQLTAYTLLGSGRVEATLEAVAIEEFVELAVLRWRTADLDIDVHASCSGIVPIGGPRRSPRAAVNAASTAQAANAPASIGMSAHPKEGTDPEERSHLETDPRQHGREACRGGERCLDVSA